MKHGLDTIIVIHKKSVNGMGLYSFEKQSDEMSEELVSKKKKNCQVTVLWKEKVYSR